MACTLLGSKRGWSSISEEASTLTDDTALTSYSSSSFVHGNCSPGKKCKQGVSGYVEQGQKQQAQFFVWDHEKKASLPGQLHQPLLPADSSSANTFVALPQLASCDVLQAADQMDCDFKPAGLVRTSSAPELLKLAQADSSAWQAMHAAGSAGAPQSAFLSHHNYWLT